MKNYKVNLARSYVVSVNAENKEDAKSLAEFFVGDCSDVSKKEDCEKYNFSIGNIDMVLNEAMEVEQFTD